VLLGIEFLDQVKAVPIPFSKSLCILEEGHPSMVPLARESSLQARQISAMQLSKGFKKAQPTFLACLKEEGVLEPARNLPSEILPIL